MKAKSLFLVAATCASSVVLAEPIQLALGGDKATLELYGRVQLTAEHVTVSRTYLDWDTEANGVPTIDPLTHRIIDGPGADRTRLRNNRSVIGFRGDIKIDNDLRGVWQVESSAAADGGTGLHVPPQTWANRDSGVGIESKKYGRLILGSWQTPYTHSTFGYDPFYTNTGAYMGIMGNGSGASMTPITDNVTFDRREHNMIQYWSPDMNGFKVRAGYDFNDNKTVNVPGATFPDGHTVDPVTARNPYLMSLETTYEKGPLHLTYAYELHHQFQDATGNDSGMKVGAAYWFGRTRVAGVVQRLQYHAADGDLQQNQFYVSAVHKLTDHDLLKLSYAKGGEVKGTRYKNIGYLMAGPDSASSLLSVGTEHQFNQYFAAFVYFSKTYNQKNAFMDFPLNDVAPSMGVSPSISAAGLRITF